MDPSKRRSKRLPKKSVVIETGDEEENDSREVVRAIHSQKSKKQKSKGIFTRIFGGKTLKPHEKETSDTDEPLSSPVAPTTPKSVDELSDSAFQEFSDDNDDNDSSELNSEDFNEIDEDDFVDLDEDDENSVNDEDGREWLQSSGFSLRASQTGAEEWEYEVTNSVPFVVLARKDILARQDDALAQVGNFLGNIPPNTARVLLARFKWDTMNLLDRWAENSAKVCQDCGLPPPDVLLETGDGSSLRKSINAGGDVEYECSICCCDYTSDEMSKLTCGHRFCLDCLRGYLDIEIREKNTIISCPGLDEDGQRCTAIMDEKVVLELVGSKKNEARFEQSLIDSYIASVPNIKRCPAPNCDNAILLLERNTGHNEAVMCKCGMEFCFRCSQVEHLPATCKMMRDWASMDHEEQDMIFIKSIARPCPSCNTMIQKNLGCNHMTCRSCHYHFCWLCLGKFGSGPKGGSDGYGNHKCNSLVEDTGRITDDEKKKLAHFQFYFHRWENHKNSRMLEKKLLERLDRVCYDLMDKMALSLTGVEYVNDAVQRLLKNRRTLMNSYIFGFYRPSHVPKELFENLQCDVERYTEALSGAINLEDLQTVFESRDLYIAKASIAHQMWKALVDAAASSWNI